MKNWLNDPRFGCTIGLPNSIKEYLKIEDDMISKNEDFIVILIFLKKINICGVSRCISQSLDANPNGILPHFLLQVFLLDVQVPRAKCLNDEKSKM